MSTKIKFLQFLVLLGLLMGAIFSAPKAASQENTTLAFFDTGIILMGDCSGEGGTCG